MLRPPCEDCPFNIKNNETETAEYIFDIKTDQSLTVSRPFIIKGSIDKENGCFQMNKHHIVSAEYRSLTRTDIPSDRKIYDSECSVVITSEFEHIIHKIKIFGKLISLQHPTKFT